jgi:hypothetical protein
MTWRRWIGQSVFALVAFLISSALEAQFNRVYAAAKSGNDLSTCNSILTPCQSFAGAVTQVNAGGEVIVLESGGYGVVTISKAVSISAPTGIVAFIHPPSGNAVTISAGASDTVVLRGLTINGAGVAANGINVATVGALYVESCVITGFAGSDNAHGNGISFGSAGNLFVKDTIVRGNGWVGLWAVPASGTAKASIDHCRLEGNTYGLVSDSNAATTIRDSVSSGNVTAGYLGEVGGELNIENCVAANNGTGIASIGGGSTVRVSNTTVTDNATGLNVASAVLLSRVNNTVQGNGTHGSFTGTFPAE